MPRYLVERTFPDDLFIPSAEGAAKAFLDVVEGDADAGVIWLSSYVDTRRLRTYCLYEGPDPEAVRRAAGRGDLPVDRVTEVCRLTGEPAVNGRDDLGRAPGSPILVDHVGRLVGVGWVGSVVGGGQESTGRRRVGRVDQHPDAL
jgi:hypothetical protein